MIRFTGYCLWILTLLSGCNSKVDSIQETKRNIIWIVSDDLGTDLGCLGNKVVKTPNLDKLASESILYKHMHSSTPVCSPSRSGMITGMYPVSIDCHQHRTSYKDPLPEGVVPVTEHFKKAGYFVTNGNANIDGNGKTDYNFQYQFDSLFDGYDYRQRAAGQPFFAQIQVFLPHRPFYADSLDPIDPDQVSIPPYYPDHTLTRKDWALYLETIQLVDKQVGKVLKRLKEDGVLDNAVVFFIGDQGRPHLRAKQFLYESGTNTPFMVRWPDGTGSGKISQDLLLNIDLAPASLYAAGIEIPDYMQGINFLDPLQKRKFLFTAKDRMDGTVDRQRSIRTDSMRYIRNFYPEKPYTQFNAYKKFSYPVLTLMNVLKVQGKLNESQLPFMAERRPSEELYNLYDDPFELVNLANDPAYTESLFRYRIIMDEALSTFDKGIYPENEQELQLAWDIMTTEYDKVLRDRGLDPELSDEDFLKYWEETLSNYKGSTLSW